MEINQNKCPKCGSENITWDTATIFDNRGLYAAECNDCGFEGNQCFDLVFQSWQDLDDNELDEWREVQGCEI